MTKGSRPNPYKNVRVRSPLRCLQNLRDRAYADLQRRPLSEPEASAGAFSAGHRNMIWIQEQDSNLHRDVQSVGSCR